MPRRYRVLVVALTVAATFAVALTGGGPSAVPLAAQAQTAADKAMVAAGDISPDPFRPHLGGQDDLATAGLVDQLGGDVVSVLGDIQYEFGRLTAYMNPEGYVKSWGRPAILARTCPVAGNHEYWNNPGAAGFYTFFASRLAACAQSGDPGQGWYAYNLGTWRIYVLNTDCGREGAPIPSPPCGATSLQVKWLKQDLAANRRPCVMAQYHHPRWPQNSTVGDVNVQPIWQTLTTYHVDVVLNGHEHGYSRTAALGVNGEPATLGKGIRQYTIGVGGRSLLPFNRPARAGTEYRDSAHFGVAKFTLRNRSWGSSFHATDGTVLDEVPSTSCWS